MTVAEVRDALRMLRWNEMQLNRAEEVKKRLWNNEVINVDLVKQWEDDAKWEGRKIMTHVLKSPKQVRAVGVGGQEQ